MIQVAVEPANQEIVKQCKNPGSADSIICSNISQNGDLRGYTDIRSDKLSKERCEWPADNPESEWMEE